MDQAQKPTDNQAQPPRSQLDRLTGQIQERAQQAEDTLPISACKKMIDIIEAIQLDLAMASITDEFEAAGSIMDKGKFEGLSELAGRLRGLIDSKLREAEEDKA